MDQGSIQARVDELRRLKLAAKGEAEEATARVHALAGAIQDCEYWLSILSTPPKEINQ